MVSHQYKINLCSCIIILLSFSVPLKAQVLLDPLSSKGSSFSQLFEEAILIPLQTNSESTFGDVLTFQVYKDMMYIYDADTRCILLFDKAGKFINKVSKKDIPDKAAKNIVPTAFNIDPNTDELIVGYRGGENQAIFDAQGKFKRLEPFSLASFGKYIGNYSYIADFMRDVKTKSFDRLVAFTPDHQEIRYDTIVGFTGEKYYATSALYRSQKNIYTKSLDYTLYELKNGRRDSLLSFVFPLDNTLLFEPNYHNNFAPATALIKANPDGVYAIENVFYINDKLFFRLRTVSDLGGENSFIYDMKTGDYYSVGHIVPDNGSFGLQLFDTQPGSNFRKENFIFAEKDYLYLQLSAREFCNLMPESKRTIQIKATDNPVIIRLKVK